jgi:hypothetical protein
MRETLVNENPEKRSLQVSIQCLREGGGTVAGTRFSDSIYQKSLATF